MFRYQKFRRTTYTDTMIVGAKTVPCNRVAEVYVTDFGEVRIYTLSHRREAHTSLSWYFMDSGVPEHIHSYIEWEMNRSNKWKKVLYKEGGIRALQTEPRPPFQNNADR